MLHTAITYSSIKQGSRDAIVALVFVLAVVVYIITFLASLFTTHHWPHGTGLWMAEFGCLILGLDWWRLGWQRISADFVPFLAMNVALALSCAFPTKSELYRICYGVAFMVLAIQTLRQNAANRRRASLKPRLPY